MILLTWYAGVLDREVEFEVLVARLHVHEVLVEDSQATSSPARAAPVHDVDDVVGTADVAEVLSCSVLSKRFSFYFIYLFMYSTFDSGCRL